MKHRKQILQPIKAKFWHELNIGDRFVFQKNANLIFEVIDISEDKKFPNQLKCREIDSGWEGYFHQLNIIYQIIETS